MNLKQSLAEAGQLLAAGGIEDAPLEAEVMLRHCLRIGRVQLFADLDRQLEPRDYDGYRRFLERRLSGEPTAYITGHKEFYGLDFQVSPDVLIPRPETELLVEKAIAVARRRHSASLAEAGTGCGAIAVCLALNLPETVIYATDVSPTALNVARANGEKHGVSARVRLLEGDTLAPVPVSVDMVVANMPYVRTSECAGTREPLIALDGGPDGMDCIRRLCGQAGDKLNPHGTLLLEIGQDQDRPLLAFLKGLFPNSSIDIARDLAGIPRVISVELAARG